jgi:hypothetical protein
MAVKNRKRFEKKASVVPGNPDLVDTLSLLCFFSVGSGATISGPGGGEKRL